MRILMRGFVVAVLACGLAACVTEPPENSMLNALSETEPSRPGYWNRVENKADYAIWHDGLQTYDQVKLTWTAGKDAT